MQLGSLLQRSLKSYLFPTHSFPGALKGHLKESTPTILRAVVARVRKHCPRRTEKREKGKTGESRLASSPVPPGVDRHPKRGAGAKRRYIILPGGLAKRECQKLSCRLWGDEETKPSLCAGFLGALTIFTMHRPPSPPSSPRSYWLSSWASVSGWLVMMIGSP